MLQQGPESPVHQELPERYRKMASKSTSAIAEEADMLEEELTTVLINNVEAGGGESLDYTLADITGKTVTSSVSLK